MQRTTRQTKANRVQCKQTDAMHHYHREKNFPREARGTSYRGTEVPRYEGTKVRAPYSGANGTHPPGVLLSLGPREGLSLLPILLWQGGHSPRTLVPLRAGAHAIAFARGEQPRQGGGPPFSVFVDSRNPPSTCNPFFGFRKLSASKKRKLATSPGIFYA